MSVRNLTVGDVKVAAELLKAKETLQKFLERIGPDDFMINAVYIAYYNPMDRAYVPTKLRDKDFEPLDNYDVPELRGDDYGIVPGIAADIGTAVKKRIEQIDAALTRMGIEQ